MDGPPLLPAAEVERWLDRVETSSEPSDILKAPATAKMSTTEAAVPAAPVWVAQRHEDDWTATVGSEQAVVVDCCAGGADILSKMNPETFQMPLGSPVVCIKTQHLDNLHIALQRGLWIVADKVGVRINKVYEDHNPAAGEKVILVFSINRQRAFCALGEMTGPWVQEESQLPGWQETAGNFSKVGSFPVKFTHVKNVSNENFEHITQDNPNQPITNMWNGMHFKPEKGREVVKIVHEKPHFTNVLCRDKRKPYSPFDSVMSAQEVDPTVPRKYVAPSNRFGGRGRGGCPPQIMGNWRQGRDNNTPTRGQHAKRNDGRTFADTKNVTPGHLSKRNEGRTFADFKTVTPDQQRQMMRDHVPIPLKLRTPTGGGQGLLHSPSPRPGQMIKCIVDDNGNYVPVGPFEDSPALPTARSYSHSARKSTFFGESQQPQQPKTAAYSSGMHTFNEPAVMQKRYKVPTVYTGIEEVSSPIADSEASKFDPSNKDSFGAKSSDLLRRAAATASDFVPDDYNPSPKDTILYGPRGDLTEIERAFKPPSKGTVFMLGGPRMDTAGMERANLSSSRQWLPAAEQRPHQYPADLPFGAPGGGATAMINCVAMNPRTIARTAYERNEAFLQYEAIRRQAQSSANDSGSSASPSKYKDWASTSDIERQRIPPVSPLTDSDLLIADSISKKGSPTTKAFKASVNRELRTKRQGQRAEPTPSKHQVKPEAINLGQDYSGQLNLSSAKKAKLGHASSHGGSMDGGVAIPSNVMRKWSTSGGNDGQLQPLGGMSSAPAYNRGSSALSSAGHLPSSMFPAIMPWAQRGPDSVHTQDAATPRLQQDVPSRQHEHELHNALPLAGPHAAHNDQSNGNSFKYRFGPGCFTP